MLDVTLTAIIAIQKHLSGDFTVMVCCWAMTWRLVCSVWISDETWLDTPIRAQQVNRDRGAQYSVSCTERARAVAPSRC